MYNDRAPLKRWMSDDGGAAGLAVQSTRLPAPENMTAAGAFTKANFSVAPIVFPLQGHTHALFTKLLDSFILKGQLLLWVNKGAFACFLCRRTMQLPRGLFPGSGPQAPLCPQRLGAQRRVSGISWTPSPQNHTILLTGGAPGVLSHPRNTTGCRSFQTSLL